MECKDSHYCETMGPGITLEQTELRALLDDTVAQQWFGITYVQERPEIQQLSGIS
jgi:hypothetical protein